MRRLLTTILLAFVSLTATAQAQVPQRASLIDSNFDLDAYLSDEMFEDQGVLLVQNQSGARAGQRPSFGGSRSRSRQTEDESATRLASVPNMFGDFFGGGGIIINDDEFFLDYLAPAPGAAVRRVKLSENGSPIPQDRIFFNYNFFRQAAGFGDVNRYTFGLEKTFFDGQQSIEVRAPLAATLSSDQTTNGSDRATEWGNLTVVWKSLLVTSESYLIAGGVGVTTPTAESTRLFDNGDLLFSIDNHSVHLLPYVAFVLPGRLFMHGFVQMDIDTNGNPVRAAVDFGPIRLERIGVFQDATLLMVDLGVGYWLYENPSASFITAVVPTLEFHYTGTLQDGDMISGTYVVREAMPRFDIVNVTAGVHFLLGPNLTVSPALAVPLNRVDRPFDYEALVQMNWFF